MKAPILRTALFVAALAAAGSSFAQLKGVLVLTNDGEKAAKAWNDAPQASLPKTKSIAQAHRGETVTGLFFFEGCDTGEGSCDAAIEYKVLNPDGSSYADLPAYKAWSGAAPKGKAILGKAQLRIQLEPQDPLGEYQVIATLREEKGKGRELTLRTKFKVLEAKSSAKNPERAAALPVLLARHAH